MRGPRCRPRAPAAGTIGVYGTPAQVAEEIVRRFGDCDRVCPFFGGYDPSDDLITDFCAAVKSASARR